MREKVLYLLWVFLFLTTGVFGEDQYPLFYRFPPTKSQIIDVRELLRFMSQTANFSLMLDAKVRGVFRRKNPGDGSIIEENPSYVLVTKRGDIQDIGAIGGKTYEDVLKKALPKLGFGWGYYDNCLYVGRPEKMENLWADLKKPVLATAKSGAKVSADFDEIDLNSVFNIIEVYAGVGIKGTEDLSDRISLRAVDMPWERLLRAIVHLNDLRMIVSDFSITITH